MADFAIKVTPEVLENTTSVFMNKINTAHNAYKEIDELLSKTASYWDGDGRDAMINCFCSQKDYYDNAFKGMEEYVKKLLVMAGVYKEAENYGVETAQSLQTDIF